MYSLKQWVKFCDTGQQNLAVLCTQIYFSTLGIILTSLHTNRILKLRSRNVNASPGFGAAVPRRVTWLTCRGCAVNQQRTQHLSPRLLEDQPVSWSFHMSGGLCKFGFQMNTELRASFRSWNKLHSLSSSSVITLFIWRWEEGEDVLILSPFLGFHLSFIRGPLLQLPHWKVNKPPGSYLLSSKKREKPSSLHFWSRFPSW